MNALPAPLSRPSPSRRGQTVLAASVLVAGVAAVYWKSLPVPFIFDDRIAVLDNPTIRGLNWHALVPPAAGGTTTGRPLVNLSYALNFAVSGVRVWSYHALNLAIHALAALALWGVARHTVRRWGEAHPTVRSPELAAFFVAALWALHPLQSESVVCVAQRTESLYGLLYLATLYAFCRGVALRAVPPPPAGERPSPAGARAVRSRRCWMGLSWLACLLGMATKEAMVTAPVLVLLYDRTFVAGSFRAAWRERSRWYGALFFTWGLLAALIVEGGGTRGASAGFGLGINSWEYLLTQCQALVHYVWLAVWPHPLVLDYGTGVVRSPLPVAWQGALLLAALAGTAWALVRKPVLGFGGAAFFLLLAPSSSFVPLVTQTMAEHRMYLPAAVLAASFVLIVVRFVPRPGWVLAGAALALSATTAARIRDYRDPITIWTRNVANWPQGARGHNNLALALEAQGRRAEAEAQFARAVALDPRYVTAHYDYGVSLLGRGRLAAAIDQLTAAVNLAPDHADAQVNLGNALVRAGRPADALPHYEAALRVAPAADAHYDCGIALLALNRTADAAAQFEAAVAMNVGLAPAHLQLARLADAAGDAPGAGREYAAALRYAPADAATHAEFGLLLARANQLSAAEEQLRTAVRLAPSDVDARANLGNVLLLQGRAREAIACYEQVVRARPNDRRARENLELARSALDAPSR